MVTVLEDSVSPGMSSLAQSAAGTLPEMIFERARQTADAAAIAAPGRIPLSFAGLASQILGLAAELHARGITRHDRVAVVMPNGPEMAVTFLGVASCAACAPLNPELTADEFDFYLGAVHARALIVQAGSRTRAREVAIRRAIPIIELELELNTCAGTLGIRTASHAARAIFDQARPGDVALVLHTSGTTARPKTVLLTHANLRASARHIAATLQLSASDRCLNVMPLFHIHGLAAAVLASLEAGGSVACTPGLAAHCFHDWLETLRPTWYTAVPAMHQAILTDLDLQGAARGRHALRFIRSSSAPLPPLLMAALERRFDAPVIEAYGMTEAAHQICSNPLPPGERKPGSVGPAAGPAVAIMNEAGEMLACEERGEIVIRGVNVTGCAPGDPEGGADALAQDWLRTGDLGWLDADGYLHIAGRLKEMINRGGEKISPREIDAAIERHPGVLAAAAFGVPHPTLGEEVVVAVVRKNNAMIREQELLDSVRAQLGPLRAPRRICFVDELPRTESGKIRRSELSRLLPPGRPRLASTDEAASTSCERALTPMQAALAGLWTDVLQITDLGADDDFFLRGGDSLRGARLLTRVKAVFGIELTMRQLFEEASTIAGMAHAIESARA